MELDLNKEMEVLLRRAREGGPSLPAGPHLDADTLSAFAANAIPAAARVSCVSHLADCTPCRTILAQLINHPEGISEAPAKVLAVAATPWYSKLFTLPKSAYATASLVILFGAIAVFFISQNIKEKGTEVSRNIEPAISSPKEMEVPSPATTLPPSTVEPTPETVAPTAPAVKKEIEQPPVKAKDMPEAPSVTAGAPPPPAPAAARVADEQVSDEVRNEAELPSARKAAPKMSAAPGSDATTVNGKTFVKKDGVWIDAQFSGETTINVKRSSEDFNRLDVGLRDIANKISGTVIVVWNGRAYRVQ